MFASPYELFQTIQQKGYFPPMAGQVILDAMTNVKAGVTGTVNATNNGTGDHMRDVMEVDRVNVFKFYYGTEPEVESTWLAGDEPGKGMMLPKWAERLMHAEVMVMKGKVECSIDYILHSIAQNKVDNK